MILKNEDSVRAAGINTFGQLGIDSKRYLVTANFVEVVTGHVNAVVAGGGHSLVLKQDGSVWATGRNKYGQLGDGSRANKDIFVQVIPSCAKAVAAGAGAEHSLVVMRDGNVWGTGYNSHGQLGDGSTTGRKTFYQ